MSVSHAGRKIDLRVATLPTVYGEKVVMRILDNNGSNMDMAGLHLLERNAEVYRASYTKPYGMILVTGRETAENAARTLAEFGEQVFVIGEIKHRNAEEPGCRVVHTEAW